MNTLLKKITDIVPDPSILLPHKSQSRKKTKNPVVSKSVLPSGNKTTYHLVLSGGGLRGFAHIGVYKALVQQGYEISSVAGTSMGALVGAFIAAKKTPEEIEHIFTAQSIYSVLKIAFSRDAMFSLDRIQEIVEQQLGYTTIESLPLPLTICVTDFTKAKVVYKQEGEILPYLIASCAIPGIFQPVHIDGGWYIDGGVYDNFPVKAYSTTNKIIGSHVNPRVFDEKNPLQDIGLRTLQLLI